ncbi:MAG TPA: energy-coupling factor transporter transmembrane protein EcfT [Chloroflexota bacterium]|nr:energy-coupling factor transporter transmembrane protein EcfT [Chloroflexota bacterium]
MSLDPRSRLISTLFLMFPLLLTPSWAELGVYVLILLLGMWLTGEFKAVSRAIFPVTLLAFGIAAFSALASPGERTLLGGLLPISVDGLEVGTKSGIRMVELVALGALLAATTPPAKLAAALGWIISPMRHLKVDVPSLEFVVVLVFQFVPILKSELAATETAMYLRGARYTRNPIDQIRRLSVLPVPLLRRLLVATDEMAIALLSRGYRLDKRMSGADMRFRRVDLLAMGGSAILAICVIAASL